MNMLQVKAIAKEQGVAIGRLRKKELIQAIQRSENNNPCYSTGQVGSCGQDACRWIGDCS